MKDRVKQFIAINVTARVFMLCSQEGVREAKQIRQYEKQIRDALLAKSDDSTVVSQVEQYMQEELEHLKKQIHGIADPEKPAVQEDSSKPEEVLYDDNSFVEEKRKTKQPEVEGKTQNRQQAQETGYVPEYQTQDKKLIADRKPVGELLKKDCVDFGLLTRKRAKYWMTYMSGRVREEAEADIVSELKDKLQQQVKSYIRKNRKKNPWSTPQLQEDLRSDISMVKSVKGVVMLAGHIHKEIAKYEGGKPGILKRLMKKKI